MPADLKLMVILLPCHLGSYVCPTQLELNIFFSSFLHPFWGRFLCTGAWVSFAYQCFCDFCVRLALGPSLGLLTEPGGSLGCCQLLGLTGDQELAEWSLLIPGGTLGLSLEELASGQLLFFPDPSGNRSFGLKE